MENSNWMCECVRRNIKFSKYIIKIFIYLKEMPVRKSRKKCLHGRKKSARRGCKSRPGPKRKSRKVARRSRKKSMRRSRCQYGRKKSARRGCKSRPGPKRRSRRRSVRRSTRRRVRRSKTYKYNMNHSDPHMLKKQLKDIKNIMDPIIKEQVKQFKFKYGYKMHEIILQRPIQPWQVQQNSLVKRKAQWSDFDTERKNRRQMRTDKAFQADAISIIINIFIMFLIYFFVLNSVNDAISHVKEKYAGPLAALGVTFGIIKDQHTSCTQGQYAVDILMGSFSVIGEAYFATQGGSLNVPSWLSSPNRCQAKLANIGNIGAQIGVIAGFLGTVLVVGSYTTSSFMKILKNIHNRLSDIIFDRMVPYDEKTNEIVGNASTETQQQISPDVMSILQQQQQTLAMLQQGIQQKLQQGQPLLVNSSRSQREEIDYPEIQEIEEID